MANRNADTNPNTTNTVNDISILRSNTGLGEIEAERLYQSCDCDVVEAILTHQGFQSTDPPTPEPILTHAQQKIKELREIANIKDARMDAIIAQSKQR